MRSKEKSNQRFSDLVMHTSCILLLSDTDAQMIIRRSSEFIHTKPILKMNYFICRAAILLFVFISFGGCSFDYKSHQVTCIHKFVLAKIINVSIKKLKCYCRKRGRRLSIDILITIISELNAMKIPHLFFKTYPNLSLMCRFNIKIIRQGWSIA